MCSSIQLFKAIGGVCYLSKIRLVFVSECVEGGFCLFVFVFVGFFGLVLFCFLLNWFFTISRMELYF